MVRHLSFKVFVCRVQCFFGVVFKEFFIDFFARRKIRLFNNIDHPLECYGQRFEIRGPFQILNRTNAIPHVGNIIRIGIGHRRNDIFGKAFLHQLIGHAVLNECVNRIGNLFDLFCAFDAVNLQTLFNEFSQRK